MDLKIYLSRHEVQPPAISVDARFESLFNKIE
jgi:hypothetical protein